MKNLLKYMLLAGVVILTASCEREPLTDEGGEGAVNLAIDLSAETRAINQSDFTPDPLKVRIYRPEGTDSALIRRYTKMEEIPDPLYLVAGNYSVKVEAGDKENVAFVEADEAARKLKLCYEGWKPFTVAAHTNSTIEVACPTINVRANLLFDTSDSEMDTSHDQTRPKYENRLISDVKITVAALTTTAQSVSELKTAIAEAEAPVLTFEQFETTADAAGLCTASGYFLMPEGVKTLVWAFEGTHETDGAIARVGTISNVKQAHAYKVRFNYSRTPDGYARVEVFVDESVETMDDKWYFKPQPEITGAGIDAAGINTYTEGSDVVLVCESINDLKMLSLGGVTFFADGEPVQGAIAGVTCVKDEATKATITVSEAYFDTLNGGVQALEFGMQDAGGADVYAQKIQFFKQGLVVDETATDLWANTATFKALVQSSVSNVEIRYRMAGATDWNTLTAVAGTTADGFTTYTAASTAGWIEMTNGNEHTIYKPDMKKSIFADNSYEYQLLFDGVAEGPAALLAPTTTQTIPYATFEDSSLACYGYDTGVAPFWGSGNNSYTPSLCSFSTYAGMQGAHCSKLQAALGGVSGFLELLAAGNLFTGTFNKPLMTGTVAFGVKYSYDARPTALKLKFWGNLGNVNRDDKKAGKIPKEQPDEASILVAIVDWSSRHEVTSGMDDPTGMWSPEDGVNAVNNGVIIGYGVAYPTGKSSHDGMIDYEVPIVYYNTTTKPSANYTLVISCATSRYGDYMNGCSTNFIYIDDIRWSYAAEFDQTFAKTTY